MKHILLILITTATFSTNYIHADTSCTQSSTLNPVSCRKEGTPIPGLSEMEQDEESSQQILNNFAQIMGHFFNLVSDPENPTTVTPAVLGIVQGIIGIAMEATKTGDVTMLHTLEKRLIELTMRRAAILTTKK